MLNKKGIFYSMRPGACLIIYVYIDRIDINLGNFTISINYSNLNNPNVFVKINDLLPNVSYSNHFY